MYSEKAMCLRACFAREADAAPRRPLLQRIRASASEDDGNPELRAQKPSMGLTPDSPGKCDYQLQNTHPLK
jgi:hypothetical protein